MTQIEKIYGELYNSKLFVQEDIRLQNSPAEPGCDLPRAIAGLMFWSDATQVTQFGRDKVWPGYLYFGNQSKYGRARPSACAGHHIAYFPSVSSVNPPTPQLLAHCRRELFHAAWSILLDSDFLHAYEHGIVVDCIDGVRRRIYPRIFTYSADYPEKVLIATVRDKGRCPCPRCLVTFDDIVHLGEESDRNLREDRRRADDQLRMDKVSDARSLIYNDGYVVNSTRVDEILQDQSLVPTTNAFLRCLNPFNFDLQTMLVVDLLHEYELGIWKSLFTHLVRILDAIDGAVVQELNQRFRQVPTFGRSTIRKFAYNVSEMKRMAARDFEDILQCIIPCIEGLIPSPHNESILTLLYHMAYWHALAKMRMHTDTSLSLLDNSTIILGHHLRYFAYTTCAAFDTKETASEYSTRLRANARHAAQPTAPRAASSIRTATAGTAATTSSRVTPVTSASTDTVARPASTINTVQVPATASAPTAPDATRHLVTGPAGTAVAFAPHPMAPATSSGRRRRTFNLKVVKLHFLGDYSHCIRCCGTTDSYTSQTGEHEHRRTKARRKRTNYVSPDAQMVKMDVREATIRRMGQELSELGVDVPGSSQLPGTPPETSDTADLSPSEHHHIAQNEKTPISLPQWLRECPDDVAVQGFAEALHEHCHARLHSLHPSEQISPHTMVLQHDRIYAHATLQVNYTTYDLQRDQDIIHIGTSKNGLMVHTSLTSDHYQAESGSPTSSLPATESAGSYPWSYAIALGVYHANVKYVHANDTVDTQRLDFVWVRWLDRDINHPCGPSPSRLERVGFVPFANSSWTDSFGFVDPAHILRGCHLIPAFHFGRSLGYLPPSSVRHSDGDWAKFYVNRFVDRDMFVRYVGCGVGHMLDVRLLTRAEATSPVPDTTIHVNASPEIHGESSDSDEEAGQVDENGDEDRYSVGGIDNEYAEL
ncbi:hypothetical protein C8Q77DRAFT_1217600 [Trametes polyzona]|nr:hypothetical protein C8Q77DRAFT_1217600 [Trametes polyzona]